MEKLFIIRNMEGKYWNGLDKRWGDKTLADVYARAELPEELEEEAHICIDYYLDGKVDNLYYVANDIYHDVFAVLEEIPE